MRFLEKLYQINLIVTPSLLFLETFTPPDFLQRKILVPYLYLLCLSLLLHFFLLTVINVTKQTLMSRYLLWSAISCSVVTVFMYLSERYVYPNFVFSSIFLHPEYFRFVTVYFLLACLLVLFTYIRHQPRKMAWIFPCYFSFILLSLYFGFESFFVLIGLEDGLIEWVTSLLFFGSAALSLGVGLRFLTQSKVISGAFLFLAVCCFFVAGEEISWGQRVFSLQSPEYFLEENVQKEITLHNLEPFQNAMTTGYILVGLLGVIGPFVLVRLVPKRWKVFAPPAFISAYFLPMLIYGSVKLWRGPFEYKTWEEFIELIAAAGIFLYLMVFFKGKKRNVR
ncbi:hypothetical protein H3C66_01380 [Patescibacteria group bacterium]|nr:hypothetical protein [Patescibacteria group bacterium]